MADGLSKRWLRSVAGLALKLFVSAGILYLIFTRTDIHHIGDALLMTGWRTVGLVLIAGLGIWWVEYWRFYATVEPLLDGNIETPLWRVFFSGYAFRFVIPGGHGELGRMLFIGGRYSRRLLAYIIDKGSLAVVVLLTGFFGVWTLYRQYSSYYCFLLLVIPILILLLWIIFRKRRKVFTGFGAYPYRAVLPKTIPLSLLHILLMALQYWLVLRCFDISFWAACGTVGVVMTALMLPISLAGLGVREWVSLQLLAQFDITREVALLAPLLVFLCNVLVPALIGVATLILFKMKPRLRS
ncbi:MAG: lysylphosphatidylglycerol synthase transmembrane domain-containing protein [Fidelibacterota bacterium]